MDLLKFNKLTVGCDYDALLARAAKKCAKNINSNIAANGWGGEYANSWEYKPYGDGYLVYCKVPHMPHLLENGHQIVNKRGGVGWSSPRPHIRPAFDKAKKDLESSLKTIGIKGEIE